MATTEESTLIDDLPDNDYDNQEAAEIIQKFKEENSLSDDEDSNQGIEEPKEEQTQPGYMDYFNKENILKYLKEAFIVFCILFAISYVNFETTFSYIPYLKTLPPNEMIYNSIIALIGSIIYILIKFTMEYF